MNNAGLKTANEVYFFSSFASFISLFIVSINISSGQFLFSVASYSLFRYVQLSSVAYQVILDENFPDENLMCCALSQSQSNRIFCIGYHNPIFGTG